MKPIWWLLLSSVFFAAGEFYSKKYAIAQSWQKLTLVLTSYLISSVLWLPAIRQTKTLATTGAVWSVLDLAITVILGAVIFSEKLQVGQWVGISAAAIAVYLLSL
jgi:multidrug transporter EmrE-like cation transporter